MLPNRSCGLKFLRIGILPLNPALSNTSIDFLDLAASKLSTSTTTFTKPTEHVGRKALVSISLCHRIPSHFHSLTTPREQDKEATVYIGNLDERVTDSLVWELMLQAGRIVNVHLPKDRVTQTHQGYGFVEFISEEDAEYAAKIMNQVRLYGKPIRVNKASADKQKTVEVGAELFIGNLDPMVDEKTLYDTFSRFGSLISAPKVASPRPPLLAPKPRTKTNRNPRSPATMPTSPKATASYPSPTSKPPTKPSPT